MTSSSSTATATSMRQTDVDQIESLTRQWAAIWSPEDKPFRADEFRNLFSPSELQVFDNVQGDVLTLNSVDEYVRTWEPFMKPLTFWSTKLEQFQVLAVSDTVASTSFRLVGIDTRGPDGLVLPFGQYGTHVWKKDPTLGWRIVHEHLTSFDTSKAAGKENNSSSN